MRYIDPHKDPDTLFPIPLTRPLRDILDRMHRKTGLSRAAIFRQLLLREHQAPRGKKALARSDR